MKESERLRKENDKLQAKVEKQLVDINKEMEDILKRMRGEQYGSRICFIRYQQTIKTHR